MKKNIKQLAFGVLTVLLAFCTIKSDGQTRNNLSRNHNENVNIYGTFQPKINEAFKINFKPEPFLPHFRKSVFDIEPAVSTLPTNIVLKPIKPPTIRIGKSVKSFENYFRLGIGSLFSPYAEFFHSAGKRKSYRLDFHLFHFSSWKNIKDYLPSPFSSTLAELSFEKYFRYHTFSIDGAYNFNTNRYYGLKISDYQNSSINTNDPLLKQAYSLAQFGLGLESKYKNKDKLTHSVFLHAYYYFDKYGTSELNGNLSFDAHKAFAVTEMLDYQRLGIQGDISYYQNSDSLTTVTNDLYFKTMPYFNFKYDFVAFKAGLDFEVQGSDSTKFHFYPFLHASLNLVPDVVTVFAGIDGGLKKNSFKNLTYDNPFLSSVPGSFLWTNNKVNLFAGIKGNVSRRFGFQLKYRFRKFENMALFKLPSYAVTMTILPWYKNEFFVDYVSGNESVFEAAFSYRQGEKLKIWLNGFYDIYQLNNDAIPYFKPKMKIDFGTSLVIKDKIKPYIEVWYVSTRRGSVKIFGGFPLTNSVTLDAYIDLNVGLSYYITKNLSIFIEGTNLLNKKYMLFTDYPVGGVQVMGGITYRF